MCVYDERSARCESRDISADIPMWLKNGVSSHSYIGHCLERQTMGVNKYASTFPMASCNKKTCNHRKKTWRKKEYENTQMFLQVSN